MLPELPKRVIMTNAFIPCYVKDAIAKATVHDLEAALKSGKDAGLTSGDLKEAVDALVKRRRKLHRQRQTLD